ncbi:MAG: hypothetical protein ACKVOU_01840 [Cytophagales bacterium]
MKDIEQLDGDSEFKNTIVNEFKRVVIKEIKGIDVSYKKYKLIEKSGVLDKYSNNQIKAASKFFDYSGAKLVVKIPIFEKILSISFLVFAIFIIIISILIYALTLSTSGTILRYVLLMGTSILTMVCGFYIISEHSAPANVARLIKNDLEREVNILP